VQHYEGVVVAGLQRDEVGHVMFTVVGNTVIAPLWLLVEDPIQFCINFFYLLYHTFHLLLQMIHSLIRH
jgi:hypothetical protein